MYEKLGGQGWLSFLGNSVFQHEDTHHLFNFSRSLHPGPNVSPTSPEPRNESSTLLLSGRGERGGGGFTTPHGTSADQVSLSHSFNSLLCHGQEDKEPFLSQGSSTPTVKDEWFYLVDVREPDKGVAAEASIPPIQTEL